MDIEKILKSILQQQLQLSDVVNSFVAETPLLGALPEFDSMGVVNILTALEESFGFAVDDDEISAESFETFGSLIEFIKSKL